MNSMKSMDNMDNMNNMKSMTGYGKKRKCDESETKSVKWTSSKKTFKTEMTYVALLGKVHPFPQNHWVHWGYFGAASVGVVGRTLFCWYTPVILLRHTVL